MNITFIGMSGVGKSTVGKIIARDFGHRFVDTDKIIEAQTGFNLQSLLDKIGDEKFIKLEEKTILDLSFPGKTVVAPGGSVVYSAKAMKHLKNYSTVIYLSIAPDEIEKRISATKKSRGIVGLKCKTLTEIYHEREHLYKQHAHIQIQVAGKTPEAVAEEIKKKLKV